MSNNYTDFSKELYDAVKRWDLGYASFGLGVALYRLITEGRASTALSSDFEETFREWFPEVEQALEQAQFRRCVESYVQMLDIAQLDELARHLAGEEE